MAYVDGFVIPIPKKNLAAYRKVARAALQGQPAVPVYRYHFTHALRRHSEFTHDPPRNPAFLLHRGNGCAATWSRGDTVRSSASPSRGRSR